MQVAKKHFSKETPALQQSKVKQPYSGKAVPQKKLSTCKGGGRLHVLSSGALSPYPIDSFSGPGAGPTVAFLFIHFFVWL